MLALLYKHDFYHILWEIYSNVFWLCFSYISGTHICHFWYQSKILYFFLTIMSCFICDLLWSPCWFVNPQLMKLSDKDIAEMVFLPVVNEACRVLDEGIAVKASDLDIASIMGMGFPPYRFVFALLWNWFSVYKFKIVIL